MGRKIDDDKPVFGPERPPKKTNSSWNTVFSAMFTFVGEEIDVQLNKMTGRLLLSVKYS